MTATRHAEIVIVGGGAVGCSIAYHLAKLGKRDVVLLEKAQLTHGATWHAAGLVGQLRAKRNLTRLMQYSAELYGRLEAETGQAVDWHPVGSLRIASSPERWQEIKRTATIARSFGFELHLISAKEAQEKFPLMTTEGVVGAAWVPTDGYVDPYSLTQAYAKGARNGGVKIHEHTRVLELTVEGRRVTQVVTDQGTWSADVVVNAAGLWAKEVGRLAGVALAAGVVEHQYLVTEKSDWVPAGLPTFRDPDKLFYLKGEPGALALGGWEPDSVPFGERGMPTDFARQLLPSNFERFEQIATLTQQRLPIFGELGVRSLINGPIPVSADGEPILGPVPELDNFYVACGFTAGIAGSGGGGRALANWIVEGDPGMDLWSFDVRRFGPQHATRAVLSARAVEAYGGYYLLHYPGEERHAARGLRRSPLYDLLKARRAVFGARFGWERPTWFAPPGVEPVDRPSFGRPNWFEHVGAEHRAVRERVALIDQSSFSKFEIKGPGALKALQGIAASDLDKAPGTTIYTQLLNAKGGIEADVTLSRIGEQAFYLVTGSAFGVRDRATVEKHLPRDGSVSLTDVTNRYAVINLCGPLARKVLEQVAEEEVSNAAFPFSSCRRLTLGGAQVRAVRIGYVGELGWELHIPVEYAAHVYELLRAAGEAQGIADVGYRAIDTLRMEKGYLYWSSDITPDYTPFEAGLGFRVSFRKGDYLGRAALEKQKAEGVQRRLCTFTLDARVTFAGSEAIHHDGKVVGTTSSANWGHTVGKLIAFGYLPVALAGERHFEIEAYGERYPAERVEGPRYDPRNERLKS
jgi:sarcosine dehydrogenase